MKKLLSSARVHVKNNNKISAVNKVTSKYLQWFSIKPSTTLNY